MPAVVPDTHPQAWVARPWTAPEQRAPSSSPTRRQKVVTPMPLQTKVVPLFHKKAGDPKSGRITAETLLAYLSARHAMVDEWKIRKMVAEADVDDVGLSPAAVRCCIEGTHKHREFGAKDWLQVVGMVLGCSAAELQQRINAASKGPRLTISTPGKPFEAEEEIEAVYSKSSPKHPCNIGGGWIARDAEEVDAEAAPGPWSSLLRNSLASQTLTQPSSSRVVSPAGAATLMQAPVERSINNTVHKSHSAPRMSFQAQREFNAHDGGLRVAHSVSANAKSFPGATSDPRLTQSARPSRSRLTASATEEALSKNAHRSLRSGPRRKHFISMAGVPPVAYVPKEWAAATLPTEEANRRQLALWAGREGSERRQNKGPSSSLHFYRSVRAVNDVNAAILRPRSSVTLSRSAMRASEAQRHRPSTAVAPHTASVHPGAVIDTMRISGRLTATGLVEGGDVRTAVPQRHVNYPQPSSALKQLRHNQTQHEVQFVTGVQPLKTGAACQRDFQRSLGGHDIRNTLPVQYWAS